MKNELQDQAYIFDFYSFISEQKELKGTLLFVGAFMGLVVLTATGSILFFKQMTEAEEEQARYAILLRLGTERKQIIRSISKQVLHYFMLPLLLALIHSTFAMFALSNAFEGNFLLPVVTAFSCIFFIYTVFYVLTVRSYTKTALSAEMTQHAT